MKDCSSSADFRLFPVSLLYKSLIGITSPLNIQTIFGINLRCGFNFDGLVHLNLDFVSEVEDLMAS